MYLENSVVATDFSRYDNSMILRERELREVLGLLKRHRAVGLLGARQVGKTTLAHAVMQAWRGPVTLFDLENPEDLARLADPWLALSTVRGLVVLDEIQRIPELFPVLRALIDRPAHRAKYLVLGSASPELLRQSSESLAGRIVYRELAGLSLEEVGTDNLERLWLRGGFPRSFCARSNRESAEWRTGFVRTFLERDLAQMGSPIHGGTARRFWTMLAHYHGQIWNASEFGRSFGVADTTVRKYLDWLSGAYVVRQLPPWHENIGKRQVKAPKVYIADSGLLHSLLGLHDRRDVEGHPKSGASWEGFVICQLVQRLGAAPADCYFWATHGGAELDLLVVRGRQRLGFEVKLTTAPALTPSMRHALEDLKLQRLFVLHAGTSSFELAKRVRAVAAADLIKELQAAE